MTDEPGRPPTEPFGDESTGPPEFGGMPPLSPAPWDLPPRAGSPLDIPPPPQPGPPGTSARPPAMPPPLPTAAPPELPPAAAGPASSDEDRIGAAPGVGLPPLVPHHGTPATPPSRDPLGSYGPYGSGSTAMPPPLPAAAVPPQAGSPPGPGYAATGAPPPRPYSPSPLTPQGYPITSSARPGMIGAIAGLTLAGGIWAVLMGLIVALSSMCLWIPWIMGLATGIWAIIHGAGMLQNPDGVPPKRAVAVCLIICILNCDVVSMVLGILILVFSSSPDVRAYYESRGLYY